MRIRHSHHQNKNKDGVRFEAEYTRLSDNLIVNGEWVYNGTLFVNNIDAKKDCDINDYYIIKSNMTGDAFLRLVMIYCGAQKGTDIYRKM